MEYQHILVNNNLCNDHSLIILSMESTLTNADLQNVDYIIDFKEPVQNLFQIEEYLFPTTRYRLITRVNHHLSTNLIVP